ncbi:MAG: hypothetical protein JSW28_04280 [Thermoplasmata archaeon]|nr:MAG: hypothetical protein JSW28_04280 [Thermoplasmata archaeon]
MGLMKYILGGLGLFFLFFGFIYLLASGLGPRYALMGVGFIAIACVLFFFAYRLEKARISRPRLVSQDIHVGVSGDVRMERFNCRGCGNPLKEKDVKMADGAVVMSCPYCQGVYQLEEEPKW